MIAGLTALEVSPDGDAYVSIGGTAYPQGAICSLSNLGLPTLIKEFDISTGNLISFFAGSDGVLYGTTDLNQGTIFRLTTQGGLTILADLRDSVRTLSGPMFRGRDGNLYGAISRPKIPTLDVGGESIFRLRLP